MSLAPLKMAHNYERNEVATPGFGYWSYKSSMMYQIHQQYSLFAMLKVFHWTFWIAVAVFAVLFFIIILAGSKFDIQYAGIAVVKAFLCQTFDEMYLLKVIHLGFSE